MTPYRFDLHVHSRHSRDARGTVLELAEAAQAAGLHGFALTDHDTVAGHAEIRDAMEATGLLIVPGIEVTTAAGHILAIGCEHPIAKGLGVDEAAAYIRQHAGIPVAAHPFRFLTGIGPQALEEHAEAGSLAAIEAINARERRLVHDNTMRAAHRLGLPAIGGSDAHWVRDVGNAYTEFDHMPGSTHELVQMVREGACQPGGGSTRRLSVLGHQVSLAVPPLRRRVLAKVDARR